MDLQLGLALSSTLAKGSFDFDLNQDYHETEDGNKSFPTKREFGVKGDDDHFVVGWPPVKSRRDRSYWRNSGDHPASNYVLVKNSAAGSRRGRSNSLFVKVKMEGIGIARKIDLNLHHSYQTLVPNLVGMFGKYREDVGKYNLMYQNKEGEWLLAGDVPWVTLVTSVRLLKLAKKI